MNDEGAKASSRTFPTILVNANHGIAVEWQAVYAVLTL